MSAATLPAEVKTAALPPVIFEELADTTPLPASIDVDFDAWWQALGQVTR